MTPLRALILLFSVVMTTAVAAQVESFAARLDALWDFDNPVVSEERFRAEVKKWPPGSAEAEEVRTQIARTLGLQRKFADAHALLDDIERTLPRLPSHVRVRYLLERGRTFNSSGAPQRAVPLFAEALELSQAAKDEFYAVDAAHMLGIAAPPPERLGWNLRALALAEAASDARARGWRASLYNNIGWTYFDDGKTATALDYWQKALVASQAAGNAHTIRIAKWTVARGYRAVGRLDDAEAVQKSLAAELAQAGESDGYVYEELAEIALARGDAKSAAAWAAKAHAALKDDASVAANEGPRLARLAAIAGGQPLPPAKPRIRRNAAPSSSACAPPIRIRDRSSSTRRRSSSWSRSCSRRRRRTRA
jgi:tetratricopeptide (TPR) repeat protein